MNNGNVTGRLGLQQLVTGASNGFHIETCSNLLTLRSLVGVDKI